MGGPGRLITGLFCMRPTHRGFPGAARLRQQAGQLTVFADLERLVEGMLAAQSAAPQP